MGSRKGFVAVVVVVEAVDTAAAACTVESSFQEPCGHETVDLVESKAAVGNYAEVAVAGGCS